MPTPAIYETRRDWILAEMVIGIVSCSTGISGLSGGVLALALKPTASNVPWFFAFYGTGAGLLLIAVLDYMCRRRQCRLGIMLSFAYVRMILHCGNALCWFTACLWLVFTETYIAAILYESIPLMLFNVWGALEHAKAIWLKPAQAGTCSLAYALLRRLSRG
jgi:hypothetical protein